MTFLIKKIAPAFLLLLPLFTYAHEGHGVYHGDDLRHYWYSSEHAIPLLALSMLFAVILVRMIQLMKKQYKN